MTVNAGIMAVINAIVIVVAVVAAFIYDSLGLMPADVNYWPVWIGLLGIWGLFSSGISGIE